MEEPAHIVCDSKYDYKMSEAGIYFPVVCTVGGEINIAVSSVVGGQADGTGHVRQGEEGGAHHGQAD